MSPKSILLHLDSSPDSAGRVQVARHLAELFEAEVTGLHCVHSSLLRYPYSPASIAAIAADLKRLEAARTARAEAAFLQAAAGSRRLRWEESDAPWHFARRAFYADLLILGQGPAARIDGGEAAGRPADEVADGSDDDAVDDVPADFVPSVLMESGRPALVVPRRWASATVGETVLIAWKETREAARAVAASLPWLCRAVDVHVVCHGPKPEGPLAALQGHLKAHGVPVILHEGTGERGDVGLRLLSLAAQVGASLLVMGCYGHSRAREWALGGATRTVLSATSVPVLMVY